MAQDGRVLRWDRGVLSSSPTMLTLKLMYCITFNKVAQMPALSVKASVALMNKTHVTYNQDCGGVMGSNPSSMGSKFNWFLVKMTRLIVKYKFLHMFRQEICGSVVRALPHGFRGCWFKSSQISAICVNGLMWVRRCGGSRCPPLTSSTMSSRGYTSAWRKKNCYKFFHFPVPSPPT